MLSVFVNQSISNRKQVGTAAGTNNGRQDMPVGWQQLLLNRELFTLFF